MALTAFAALDGLKLSGSEALGRVLISAGTGGVSAAWARSLAALNNPIATAHEL
jgi:NADPH:quinone reductase-like Zn-dependent oxidoreductase